MMIYKYDIWYNAYDKNNNVVLKGFTKSTTLIKINLSQNSMYINQLLNYLKLNSKAIGINSVLITNYKLIKKIHRSVTVGYRY